MKTTTVILAVVIFSLLGTMVFAAIAPYLSTDANATVRVKKGCNPHSPDGQDGQEDGQPGCGPTKRAIPR